MRSDRPSPGQPGLPTAMASRSSPRRLSVRVTAETLGVPPRAAGDLSADQLAALSEHVLYECEMLEAVVRLAGRRGAEPLDGRTNVAVENALVECFGMHVRALIESLYTDGCGPTNGRRCRRPVQREAPCRQGDCTRDALSISAGERGEDGGDGPDLLGGHGSRKGLRHLRRSGHGRARLAQAHLADDSGLRARARAFLPATERADTGPPASVTRGTRSQSAVR